MITQQEAASADYEDNPLWRITGAKILAIGANAVGEIYLQTDRGDEFIVGKDEQGEIGLFMVVPPGEGDAR